MAIGMDHIAGEHRRHPSGMVHRYGSAAKNDSEVWSCLEQNRFVGVFNLERWDNNFFFFFFLQAAMRRRCGRGCDNRVLGIVCRLSQIYLTLMYLF
jgi:hypothetical protein